ncbi:hypothetical protein Hanom_Chr13g01223171 [Helianthus anomalus]
MCFLGTSFQMVWGELHNRRLIHTRKTQARHHSLPGLCCLNQAHAWSRAVTLSPRKFPDSCHMTEVAPSTRVDPQK